MNKLSIKEIDMLELEEQAKLHEIGTILRRGNQVYEVANDLLPVLKETREGVWLQIRNGKNIYVPDIKLDEIHVDDIAHALGMKCRWSGWTREFFSVNQHSILVLLRVLQICPDHLKTACSKFALFHDSAEAYLFDVPSPLKTIIPGFVEIEEEVLSQILLKAEVEITDEVVKWVKKADLDVLFLERDCLISNKGDPYPNEHLHPKIDIYDLDPDFYCWSPQEAKENFINVYYNLFG